MNSILVSSITLLTVSHHSDGAYREGYLNLLSIEPKISDLVTDRPLAEIASQLDKGRSEFRNSEICVINDKISRWGFGVPEDKHLRGFGNDVCGRLMCPSTQDWENPTYGMICLYSPRPL